MLFENEIHESKYDLGEAKLNSSRGWRNYSLPQHKERVSILKNSSKKHTPLFFLYPLLFQMHLASIAFLCMGAFCFAGTPKTISPEQKDQVCKSLKGQTVKFLENKGQMMDWEGNPVPFVLFKAEGHGVNVFITETGLTWQTLKVEEDQESEKETESESETIASAGYPDHKNDREENIKIEWERIDVLLKGASIKKENIIKENPSVTNFNFFYPHCRDGIYGAREYEKITIKDVYPGIDWVFYTSPIDPLSSKRGEGGFKYDFVVNPGADYKQIELIYKSKSPVKINSKGEIELRTREGNINENSPVSFLNGKELPTQFIRNDQKTQEVNGEKGYETSISFHLPSAISHPTSALIIDPQLWWATSFGGNAGDGPRSIDTDNNGNVFVTGYVSSSNFPVQNSGTYFQGTYAGGVVTAFILKYNNAGILQWCTYYGGNSAEGGFSIATDGTGNIFVTGYTSSTNLPLQNAGSFFQGAYGGGAQDAFILKFDNSGNRLWATYYGGSGTYSDIGNSIDADINGNIFITGHTDSPNFPVQNAGTFFQGTLNGSDDAFILKFDNAGNRLWASYYGGTASPGNYPSEGGTSITTDAAGNIFVTGWTAYATNFPVLNSGVYFQSGNAANGSAFILKFDNAGNRLWATCYGGTGFGHAAGRTIAVDAAGNVFVAGDVTNGITLPLQNSGTYFKGSSGTAQDAFILKFDNSGNRLWATCYGGSAWEYHVTYDNLAIDNCGNVYMSFITESSDLPVQASCDGGYNDNSYNSVPFAPRDIGIVMFDNIGNRLWATFLGGNGQDFAESLDIDANNSLYVTGEWTEQKNPATYPLTNPGGGAYYDPNFTPGYDDEGYIVKFNPVPVVANASTTQPGCSNPCGGTATANVVSPAACNYTYLWSNGQTTKTATGLCSGTYSVTLTNQMCQDTLLTATVNPAAGSLTLNATGTPANCGSSNGSATVTVNTGTPSYTYLWSPGGASLSTATGLNAGTYTVTVTDATGCSSTQTVTIANSNGPIATMSQTNINCSGSCTGAASATTSGGSIPYSYLWTSGQTTSSASNLCVGGYTLIITDAGGCTKTETVTITQPTAVTVSVITNTASCSTSNGNATSTPSGGSSGYSYNWSNGQTTPTATGLAAGTYTILITDAAGCTQTALANISNSGSPQASVSSASVLCNGGSSGSAIVTATVGTGPYTYSWNPSGQTTSSATGLGAGNHVVTVTDALGCIVLASDTITEPASISSSATSTNTGCLGSTGRATVTATGGTNPFIYNWSNTQTGQIASGLAAGNYTATVTDTNGCTKTQTVSVIQSSGPTASVSASQNTISVGGSSTLTATGGGDYLWSPVKGLSCVTCASPIASPTQTTTYCVLVTDTNDCKDSTCLTIDIYPPADLPCQTIYIPNAFSPNNDSENDMECVFGTCIKTFHIAIYNRWGEKVFESSDQKICWDGTYRGKALNTAVFDYYLEATFTNGETINKKGNISLLR